MTTPVTATIRATGGTYPDFSTGLADLFGCTSKDLVANDESLLIEIYNDWAGDGLADQAVFNGWNCDPATGNTITFRAAAGHGTTGEPGTGARMCQLSSSVLASLDIYACAGLTVGGPGCGIEFTNDRNNQAAMLLNQTSPDVVFDSLLLRHITSTNAIGAFWSNTTNCARQTWRNCVFRVEDAGGTHIAKLELTPTIGPHYVDNCQCIVTEPGVTVTNAFWVRSGNIGIARNCVVAVANGSTVTNPFGTGTWNTTDSTNNATPSASDDAPGGNSQTGVTEADFDDTTAWRPSASGKLQAGNGVDLSSTFNYDVSGASRGGSFTIGAFNAPAGGGTTTKTVTDAGAGSDAIAQLAAGFGLADTGAGSDAIAQLAVALGLTDAGAGSDAAPSAAAALGLADSATGADVIAALAAALGITDAGAGSDALNVITATLLSVTDAGAGADIIAALSAALGITDAGTGTDAIAGISVSAALTDSGLGADAVAQVAAQLELADTAAGSDALNLLQEILRTIADAGAGSDGLAITASVQLTDSATGIDALAAIAALFALADSGAGVDAVLRFDAAVRIVKAVFTFRARAAAFTFRSRSMTFQLAA